MKEAGSQALRLPICLDGHRLSGLYPANTLTPDNFLVPNIPSEPERPPSPIGRKDANRQQAKSGRPGLNQACGKAQFQRLRRREIPAAVGSAADVVQGLRAADDQFGEALVLHSQAIVD